MEYYNKLEDPTDEENDMLDLAFGLSEKYVPLPWNWTADCIAVQASLNWTAFVSYVLPYPRG